MTARCSTTLGAVVTTHGHNGFGELAHLEASVERRHQLPRSRPAAADRAATEYRYDSDDSRTAMLVDGVETSKPPTPAELLILEGIECLR